MPSEASSPTGIEVLAPAGESFRSALARTIEEIRAYLDTRRTSEDDQVAATQAALGAFASTRVDPQRFSALLSQSLELDAPSAERIERAFQVLRGLNSHVSELLEVSVPAGGSLREVVLDRLAEIGRAFGAAHAVTAVRAKRYDGAEHGRMLERYPFERWTAAERALAPPLVVDVRGADCRAVTLGDLLDGNMKILLRVSAPCPAAPLARLVAPRTFVLQTADAEGLAAFATWDGPGIAAVVPVGAARFLHDPAAGDGPAERLRLDEVPDAPLLPVGGMSAAQQAEDLELLAAWTGIGPAAPPVAGADDPAGQLAAWLLQQADLRGIA